MPDPVAEWLPETFPADAKTDPIFTKYKDPTEFVKGVRGMAEAVGKKSLTVPTDKSTPEEVQAFWSAVGRPEKADGYKLTDLKDLHPRIQPTPESRAQFLEQAHKVGLTTAQADGLHQWFMGTIHNSLTAQDKAAGDAKQQAETALRTKWGGSYDQNLSLAQRVMKTFGSEKAVASIGNDPDVIELFAKIGQKLSEDTTGSVGFSSLTTSTADAKRQIEAIKADPKHAWFNEKHPKHAEAVAEMRKLYQLAEGTA